MYGSEDVLLFRTRRQPVGYDVLQVFAEHWPGCVVQPDGQETLRLPETVAPEEADAWEEFFVFRDAEQAMGWIWLEEDDTRESNSLVHVLISPEAVTVVFDEDCSEFEAVIRSVQEVVGPFPRRPGSPRRLESAPPICQTT